MAKYVFQYYTCPGGIIFNVVVYMVGYMTGITSCAGGRHNMPPPPAS